MMRLEGISNTIYGAKNIVSATFGCTPVRPRSSGIPIVKALAMLTLETRGVQSMVLSFLFFRTRCLPIKKSDNVDDEQHGYEPPVDPPHQLLLCNGRRAWN